MYQLLNSDVIYYFIFVLAYALSTIGTIMNKKYQLMAGTGLFASSVYMIINGIVSAIVGVFMLIVQGKNFEMTAYSLLSALGTVVCAAIATIVTFKVYEKGQVSVATIFSSIGGIIVSCAWGIFFLGERLLWTQVVTMILIVVSVFLVILQKNTKIDKGMLWLLIVIAVATGFVSVLCKQHQVEKDFSTVNTLSYSIWVGILRAVVFLLLLMRLVKKNGREALHLSNDSLICAVMASVMSGVSYIITLITATVLPLTITSPLGTALSILMTTVMAWAAYRERMEKKQIAGVVLCIFGIFLFAWVK